MEPVPVKLKIAGQKYRGHIIGRDVDTQMMDVTLGGSIGGPPPNPYREFVPGTRSETVTVRVACIVPWVVGGTRAKLETGGVKFGGRVTDMVLMPGDGACPWTTLTIQVWPR